MGEKNGEKSGNESPVSHNNVQRRGNKGRNKIKKRKRKRKDRRMKD